MNILYQLQKKAEKAGIFLKHKKIAFIDDVGGRYQCKIVEITITPSEDDITYHQTKEEAILYAESRADNVLYVDYGDDEDGNE